jgi:hypothetical protein
MAALAGISQQCGLALREHDGAILFAHADLSGFSVFEEAAWWGDRAARLAHKKGRRGRRPEPLRLEPVYLFLLITSMNTAASSTSPLITCW